MRDADRGFVMADALIALAVASGFCLSLLSLNAATTRTLETAKHRLLAAELGQSILLDPESGENGAATLEGMRFAWQLDEDERASGHLVDLTVTVTWKVGHALPQTLTLQTARWTEDNGH